MPPTGSIRILIITGSIETSTAAGGGVAAGGGGGAAPPAQLEAMPVLVAAQMTSATASCCGPAGAGPAAAMEARDPLKMQQRLVLDTVSRGKIPWRKETPHGEK